MSIRQSAAEELARDLKPRVKPKLQAAALVPERHLVKPIGSTAPTSLILA